MLFLVIVTWIVTGLLAGFIGSKIINLRGDDPKLGIGAAVGGGLVGGFLHAMIGPVGLSDWTIWAPIYAALGAVVALAVFHLIRSRTIGHERGTTRQSY